MVAASSRLAGDFDRDYDSHSENSARATSPLRSWLDDQGGSKMVTRRTPIASRKVAPWLWILLGLFVLRVLAQLFQLQIGISSLPPFEAWQSGALPYWALLAAQIMIVLFLARVARSFSAGTVTPSVRSARLWLIPGSIYFTAMIVRLALGLTFFDGHPWLDRPLPAVFHIVLATFMIVAGLFHRLGTTEA